MHFKYVKHSKTPFEFGDSLVIKHGLVGNLLDINGGFERWETQTKCAIFHSEGMKASISWNFTWPFQPCPSLNHTKLSLCHQTPFFPSVHLTVGGYEIFHWLAGEDSEGVGEVIRWGCHGTERVEWLQVNGPDKEVVGSPHLSINHELPLPRFSHSVPRCWIYLD